MDATTVAVDLAKDVFEVALANRANRIIDRKRLTRRQFETVRGLSSRSRCRELARTHTAESTTGMRRYLGRISTRGDGDLRCPLTHEARAVLLAAHRTARTTPHLLTRLQQWAIVVNARRGHNKTAIALATKLARIVWAVWCHDADFHSPTVQTTAA